MSHHWSSQNHCSLSTKKKKRKQICYFSLLFMYVFNKLSYAVSANLNARSTGITILMNVLNVFFINKNTFHSPRDVMKTSLYAFPFCLVLDVPIRSFGFLFLYQVSNHLHTSLLVSPLFSSTFPVIVKLTSEHFMLHQKKWLTDF